MISLPVIGLLNAAAILAGFYLLSRVIEPKVFRSSSSSTLIDKNVVPLTGDRFAVVDSGSERISVYRVDGQG
ncbi:MAG: hypothetical protein KY468_02660 [Armatimonadetes bacterium]|nr:hypothetical protein [Armatimonadota bacterium]